MENKEKWGVNPDLEGSNTYSLWSTDSLRFYAGSSYEGRLIMLENPATQTKGGRGVTIEPECLKIGHSD